MSLSFDPFVRLSHRLRAASSIETYVPVEHEISRMSAAFRRLDHRMAYYTPEEPFLPLCDTESEAEETVKAYEMACATAYAKALASLHDEDRALIEKARSLADHLA